MPDLCDRTSCIVFGISISESKPKQKKQKSAETMIENLGKLTNLHIFFKDFDTAISCLPYILKKIWDGNTEWGNLQRIQQVTYRVSAKYQAEYQ